jgi:hypothetical protein
VDKEHQHEADQQSDLFSERGNWHSSSLTASQFCVRNDATVELIRTKEYSNVNKIADCNHLVDENWHEWKNWMKCVFTNCDITGYVMGTVNRPNEDNDPVGVYNWDKNDCWAQQVIIHYLLADEPCQL